MIRSRSDSDPFEFARLARHRLLGPGEAKGWRSWLSLDFWARMSTRKLCAIGVGAVLVIMTIVTIISHQQLGQVEPPRHPNSPFTPPPELLQAHAAEHKDKEEDARDCAACNQEEISDLGRIKKSVLLEMTQLEEKYHSIKQEIASKMNKITALDDIISARERQIETLSREIEQTKLLKREAQVEQVPNVWAPLSLADGGKSLGSVSAAESISLCSIENCVNYTASCSIISPLRVYAYDFHVSGSSAWEAWKMRRSDDLLTTKPENACLFFAYLPCSVLKNLKSSSDLKQYLAKHLKYFDKTGQNHVVIIEFVSKFDQAENGCLTFDLPRDLRCMFVSSTVIGHRPGFDVLTFPIADDTKLDVLTDLKPLLPARRRNFAAVLLGSFASDSIIAKILDQIKNSLIGKEPLVVLPAGTRDSDVNAQFPESTFSVLFTPSSDASLTKDRDGVFSVTFQAWTRFYTQLRRSLQLGAIPVVIMHNGSGGAILRLPFDDIVDWSRALIRWPLARLPELHLALLTMSDNDVIEMRRQGRLIVQHYFADLQTLLDSVISLLSYRLQMPPAPHSNPNGTLLTPPTASLAVTFDVPVVSETDEYLGPVEPPEPSPTYYRNLSSVTVGQYEAWNDFKSPPGWLFPSTPFESILPSDAKFKGSESGFRPINRGEGGSGREFSAALGGNVPKEQFTVVMLTFEREPVLMQSLRRLNALPYLNKVVVVWNSPTPPAPELAWPKLIAPLVVLIPGRNSLNNRFLPYEEIQTDAVLSIDDDAHLRHDEIIFGFRAWRENRDRIVGFPGRFHAFDAEHGSWNYNSNHSCELSMVLTGAAFIHKFYLYMYTFHMPPLIRDLVDEYMNCEDLAMNFLVSHITRQPPVKVTSRWTFRCPGCAETLWADESHFAERHQCISFFTRVYGYNPLLYTQYRVDSVLFKTRIPHTAQKCFKFV